MPNSIPDGMFEGSQYKAVRNDGDYVGDDGLLHCGKCKGKKETIVNLDLGDRTVTKKMRSLCKCEQKRRDEEEAEQKRREYQERVKNLRETSMMDTRFSNSTFDGLVITRFNEKNIGICKKYVNAFDQMMAKNQGLLFWGGVGTGKTLAAACIANALLEKGVTVIMTSFVRILSVFRDHTDEEAVMQRLMNAKLVIFDDLGAERGSDYAIEQIYHIVDSRYRTNRPMIMTTNLTLNEMLSEPDIRYTRIYDRIFEVCYPMQWTGDSWRKKQAGQRIQEMKKLFEEN